MGIMVLVVWLLLTALRHMIRRKSVRIREELTQGIYTSPLITHVVIRYNDCRTMNVEINNVSDFVEKLIKKYKVCGLSVQMWTELAESSAIVITAAGMPYVACEELRGIHVSILFLLCVEVVLLAVLTYRQNQIWPVHQEIDEIVSDLTSELEQQTKICAVDRGMDHTKLKGSAAIEFARLNRDFERIENRQVH